MNRNRGGIKWESDTLSPTLATLQITIYANLKAKAEEAAQKVEQFMKEEHTWKNRTTDAEKGLFARVANSGPNGFTIILGHGSTVDYGIWLEVRWGGKYAIIEPTMGLMGPEVMHSLKDLFVRAGPVMFD